MARMIGTVTAKVSRRHKGMSTLFADPVASSSYSARAATRQRSGTRRLAPGRPPCRVLSIPGRLFCASSPSHSTATNYSAAGILSDQIDSGKIATDPARSLRHASYRAVAQCKPFRQLPLNATEAEKGLCWLSGAIRAGDNPPCPLTIPLTPPHKHRPAVTATAY